MQPSAGKQIMVKPTTPPKPDRYDAEIEYLEGDNRTTDKKYSIPIGISPNLDKDVWVCSASFLGYGATAGCWGTAGNRFAFGRGANGWPDWYFGLGNTNNRTGVSLDTLRHTFTLDGPNRRFGIDENWYSGSGSTVSGNYNIAFFTRNNSTDNVLSRLYWSKYYRDGILIRDFIPVRVGQVGYLFDKISGKLFGNSGTGKFVLGPDIQKVEYVESNFTQFIDTGVKFDSDVGFDIRYRPMQTISEG